MNPYNSKLSNHWGTPKELYDSLNEEFSFDYEVCKAHSTINDLITEWGSSNFLNPPYSAIESFAKKAVEEQKKGRTTVMLIPARTSTKYFHKYILPNAEIRFIEGRLKFVGLDESNKDSKGPAGFASILCIFRG